MRQTALRSSIPKAQLRSSFRKYSTSPPQPPAAKSNTGLLVGLGAALLVGGVGAYYYGTNPAGVPGVVQAAKAATKFTPTKEDYQKVLHAYTGSL